ncbi:hypothetical protein VNO78_03829 [Psophocarpus tetragonolobus]|uniref:Uncharacterized protein n=1 Tax=Psophocarpus tetragonolobus TaxID=3891 RepID=A0AAN9T255_PSOTE
MYRRYGSGKEESEKFGGKTICWELEGGHEKEMEKEEVFKNDEEKKGQETAAAHDICKQCSFKMEVKRGVLALDRNEWGVQVKPSAIRHIRRL